MKKRRRIGDPRKPRVVYTVYPATWLGEPLPGRPSLGLELEPMKSIELSPSYYRMAMNRLSRSPIPQVSAGELKVYFRRDYAE